MRMILDVITEQLDPKKKPKKRKRGRKPQNRSLQKTTASKVVKKKVKKVKVKARKGVSSNPLQLIGVINKELPDTVRKNMKLPGLQNRTGRFAESVKVTDIVQTAKGFPSIGYTYQRNPYEVFETGSGNVRATPERDPRQLIDRSIREIAAQFALGRFYTRRV